MKRFAIFAAVLALVSSAQAQDASLSEAANQAFLAANARKPGVVVLPDGLQYRVISAGTGTPPAPTDQVDVVYSGTLINGRNFDHSDLDAPATFRVYQLIPGWTEAMTLMRTGAVWEVVIPANLAYGAKGTGGGTIPPNQTLVFEMKLVAIHRAGD